ncbi:MAG: methyltransferase [Verrucomicrobiota bacterium]
MKEPDPNHLMNIASGYGTSKALLTATGLGLYTRLVEGPMTLKEICSEYGLKERPARDWLDLLVSIDLLDRKGDGEEAVFCNNATTETHLVKGKDSYLGGGLELWEMRNFRFWADFNEALHTGEPQSEIKHTGKSFFESLYEDQNRLETFMDAMHGQSFLNFDLLAEKFPFNQYKTHVDIGGADALLSRLIAKKHPEIQCTSCDLPKVTEIADRKIAEAGLTDRISTKVIDFFTDPLPSAEIITMGMILHDWSLEQKKMLVQKAYDALPDGGAFVIVEALIDNERRKNTFGLFMSLTMLMEFGDAFDFTAEEFFGWCREAGFSRFEVIPLAGPSSAAVAYK